MRSHLKPLLVALGVVALFAMIGPALAAAETFTVNTTTDTETIGETPCVGGHQCTLRDAILLADSVGQYPGPDTISFAGIDNGSQIDVDEAPLPAITEGVTIDADTAPGATPGQPAIELVPFGFADLEFVSGLEVRGGEKTRIEGFAIGGFGIGIRVAPEEGDNSLETEICGSYLGTQINGTLANANEIGIEMAGNGPGEGAEATKIGGAGCAQNVISGNSVDGIYDAGLRTTIAGNRIGIGAEPSGATLGNGTVANSASAGIFESADATEGLIGGRTVGSGEQNLIWFNHGPGVLVEATASEISIRGNSFLENEGLGIDIPDGEQPAPTLASAVTPEAGKLNLVGTVAGAAAGETVELEFFAVRSCDQDPEGQVPLGSVPVEVGPGSNSYSVQLIANVPAGLTGITVNSTRVAGATTEFSNCVTFGPPEPEPEPEHHDETKPPAQSASTNPPITPTLNTTPTFAPTNGEKVVVKPEEGKVLIKLPGKMKYVRLEELKEVPVGAIIDATKGRVTLTSIGPDGKEQTAEFFGGVFRVKQAEGSNLVVLELLDETVCPAPKARRSKKGKGGSPRAFASSVSFRPSGRTTGKLWGSGHGNFRTEGHDGSATVRGTIWLVEDRCDGTTFFRTRRGIVSVRDFILHKTLPLPAGKSYAAGEE